MFVKRPKSNIFLYLCNIIMAENQLDFATLKNVVLLHSKRTRFASQKDSFYRRTRQTLWSAVQMLTQKLCCQTIHDCPKVVPLHYESE